MQEIKLQLTIEEANLVLEALGNLPFARVYGLIGKIQEQAGQQLNAAESQSGPSDSPPPKIGEQS